MGRFGRAAICAAILASAGLGISAKAMAVETALSSRRYENFRVAIYVVVGSTRRLADPAEFAREYDRAAGQLKFDKVYVEVYRDHQFATDAEIEAVKRLFKARGVEVQGGITLAAGGQGGQFGTFDYEKPADREECRKAVELAARHFDNVIMDDFFFYASKSDADIAAKGSRSWTQYRLDRMREVAADLVLKPARAVNPKVKMTIKYPNWYEHFQGLGFDLDQEAQMFDSIYTGTETRDPYVTDQLLQQYESYEIYRYYSNIRPGANSGGWVDTYSTNYVDRYAEQLWDTMLAKAPEITLFNWSPMAEMKPVAPGDRAAWKSLPTSFDWDAMVASYHASGANDPGPGWARSAGWSLEKIDRDIGKLGAPIAIPSYRPYQSKGEDFLHNYLGNIGIPIDLRPTFPTGADLIILTADAAYDPEIVAKIKAQLQAGKKVVITSGLLKALEGRGVQDIAEWDYTGNTVAIHDFVDGFGAGSGDSLNDPARDNPAVLFPEIRFMTNDSWAVIRGVAGAKGFPILLMNRYSKGVIYLLNIPENQGDLYNLPQGVLSEIKRYLLADFPVRIESGPQVSLFAYDNGSFVVESFRDRPETVILSVAGAGRRLNDISGSAPVALQPLADSVKPGARPSRDAPRTRFQMTIQPHSYLVFRTEG